MNLEDLRGREFIHFRDDSVIYIVGQSKDGCCTIHWEGEESTQHYRDEQVVDFFEREIWIFP